MIIWLASYPKSGNTWVRAIISALLYSNDGEFNFNLLRKIDQFPEKKYFKDFVKNFGNFDEIKSNWIIAQDKINLSKEVKLFKTHQGKYTVTNNNFTNNENTLATIYIVRDPRNVLKSISNHYTLSLKESLEFMTSSTIIGNNKSLEESAREGKPGILTLLGKWNEHYRSWTQQKKNLLVIRYEDLISNTEIELIRIINFLKKYIEIYTEFKKNKKILETTNFDYLQKLEKQLFFFEGVENKVTGEKINFFNQGPKNEWQKTLDNEIINSLEENFFEEMKELNYL